MIRYQDSSPRKGHEVTWPTLGLPGSIIDKSNLIGWLIDSLIDWLKDWLLDYIKIMTMKWYFIRKLPFKNFYEKKFLQYVCRCGLWTLSVTCGQISTQTLTPQLFICIVCLDELGGYTVLFLENIEWITGKRSETLTTAFFLNIILFSHIVLYKHNICVRNWSNTTI